jgi:predicted TPR repeat methyltransferase
MAAAWLQMAILQRKRGDMTAAVDALERLIAITPDDAGKRGRARPIPHGSRARVRSGGAAQARMRRARSRGSTS